MSLQSTRSPRGRKGRLACPTSSPYGASEVALRELASSVHLPNIASSGRNTMDDVKVGDKLLHICIRHKSYDGTFLAEYLSDFANEAFQSCHSLFSSLVPTI